VPEAVFTELVQAFITHTAALPNTTALVSDRVSGRLRTKSKQDPAGWQMPTFAIVYRDVPGPSEQEPGNVPLAREPLQVECYGPTLRESRRLWRTLRGELFPDSIQDILTGNQPQPQGFIASGCAVASLQLMGSAAPLQESPEDLPRTVATLFVHYCTRPVPV
jgi:hypothetical protein